MMADLPLWKLPTAARCGDAPGSLAAERAHTRSGRRGRHIRIVADAVAMHPGLTACELHSLIGQLERHEWSRRLPDAETAAMVRRGESRLCNVTGRLSLTWWPAHGLGANDDNL